MKTVTISLKDLKRLLMAFVNEPDENEEYAASRWGNVPPAWKKSIARDRGVVRRMEFAIVKAEEKP